MFIQISNTHASTVCDRKITYALRILMVPLNVGEHYLA